MSNPISTLNVRLHGDFIGTITHVGHDRTLFAFTEAYLNNELRPTLELSFKDSFGSLITQFKVTQTQLIPFFSNLLPEAQMRSYLAEPADGEVLPPDLHQASEDNTEPQAFMCFFLAGCAIKVFCCAAGS